MHFSSVLERFYCNRYMRNNRTILYLATHQQVHRPRNSPGPAVCKPSARGAPWRSSPLRRRRTRPACQSPWRPASEFEAALRII